MPDTVYDSNVPMLRHFYAIFFLFQETAGIQKRVNKSLSTARGNMTNSTQDTSQTAFIKLTSGCDSHEPYSLFHSLSGDVPRSLLLLNRPFCGAL